MAPTSDERREVAATMRMISCEGVHGLTLGEVLNAILTGGAPRPTTKMAILACLADLVDPTCHMTDSMWDNGECTWGCICSACGARIEHEYASDIYYCPRCGARVVSK